MSGQDELPPFNPASSLKYTQSPNPSWKYGETCSENSALGTEWVEGEKQGWKVVDTATENPGKLYALMISGIIPRPIAFVSTISTDNEHNLAPFSWFNMISHNPPTIMISCTNTPGRGPRDTIINIQATKEFTVNIISEPFIEGANFTSVDAPLGHSEWAGSGLTMAPSVDVKPPRVKESAFSMECELSHFIPLTPPGKETVTNSVIFGYVKKIHVRNNVLTEKGIVDPALFRPVARLGDISYARLGEAFRIPREAWNNVGEKIIKAEEEKRK